MRCVYWSLGSLCAQLAAKRQKEQTRSRDQPVARRLGHRHEVFGNEPEIAIGLELEVTKEIAGPAAGCDVVEVKANDPCPRKARTSSTFTRAIASERGDGG